MTKRRNKVNVEEPEEPKTEEPKDLTEEPKDLKQLWNIIKEQDSVIQDLLRKIASLEGSQKNREDSHDQLIRSLENELNRCDSEVVTLERKLSTLQGKFTLLESELLISKHVTKALEIQLDDANQYSRRNCLILNDIKTDKKDLKEHVKRIISEDLGLPTAATDIDRVHRIGHIDTDHQTQPTIIKFNTFTERSNVYKAQKKTKKMKIALNLTKRRSKLLNMALDQVQSCPNVEFVFVDENCQLKIRMHEKVKGKIIHQFNTLKELSEIISLLASHEVGDEDYDNLYC